MRDDGEPFEIPAGAAPAVRGRLHRPAAARDAIVLTHGAGSDATAPLLVALARAFAARGVAALRCDLPFRQARPHGPPSPAGAARDRAGLAAALAAVRADVARGRVFLGGHSYGGRQATLLAADDPGCAAALLLLSYPLHPPGRPAAARTAHLPRLRTPALFVHGARDPFGAPDELRAALAAVPVPTALLLVDGAGHDLGGRRFADDLPARIVDAFLALAG
jgi:predicted alpha/beta-hydrolase family hydrolase